MISRRKRQIPYRNRNHTGWWICSYLERLEWHDEDVTNSNRRCLAWENTILVRARNREEAFRKATACGRVSDGVEVHTADKTHRGVWRFEGLTLLLPVYDEIEDGSEILWTEHRGKSVKTIRAMVKPKQLLQAFDDGIR